MLRKTLLAGVAIVLAGHAHAIPIQLNAAEFAAQLAGASNVVTEDFEGFTLGGHAAPFTLANSTFTSNVPFVLDGFILPTHNLVNNAPDPATGRIFDGLAAGTTLFGLNIGGFDAGDLLSMTVVGASGILSVDQTIGSLGGFVGFSDSLGILSVTFFNKGHPLGELHITSNYAFDNVTTATTLVPEPTTLSLLAIGLLGFGAIRRSRRRAPDA